MAKKFGVWICSAFSPDLLVQLAVDDGLERVLRDVAPLPEQPGPELDADDAEDEEDEEAQQQDVPQHGQRVQQQHHQDTHACRCLNCQMCSIFKSQVRLTWDPVDGPERP